MNDQTPPFPLPESVRRYLSDSAITEAVDHLVSMKLDHVPEGLEFRDLRPFYEARTAANLTRNEYPVALLNFWNWAWADLAGDGWEPAPLDEMVAERAVNPESVWSESAITVCHRQGNYALWTQAGFYPHSIWIGFAMYRGDAACFHSNRDSFRWEGEYLIAEWAMDPVSQDFPWAVLRSACEGALRLIAEELKI